jgi:hypothetical protein
MSTSSNDIGKYSSKQFKETFVKTLKDEMR